MPWADLDELKKFAFESIRSRLAAQMLVLCREHRASYVSIPDFLPRLKVDKMPVARVLIDWTRQGIFSPSSSGRYRFSASPELSGVIDQFLRVCTYERGRKDLAIWVGAIERGLVAAPEELPEIAEPPEEAVAPGAGRPQEAEPETSGGLSREAIQEIRKYISAIPPLPLVAQQILRETSDTNSSARSIANIAIKDPSIVMNLLKMANSAFYAQAEEVVDVQRAIVVIGLNHVKHLLMASGIGRVFKPPAGSQGYNFEALWKHALGVSVAARLLVRKSHAMPEAEAGTLGLLHDIGKFAMNVANPERTEELLDPFSDEGGPTGLAKEAAIFGTTHAIYGMTLIEAWKLPNEFARIIEYHHSPELARSQGFEEEMLRGLSLVHVANQLAKRGGLDCGDRDVEQIPAFCYEMLGVPADLEVLFDAQMQKTFKQVEYFIGVAAKGDAKKKPASGAPRAQPGQPG